MTLEEKILKILLDNTDTEGRYVGGGHEPEIIVFKNSEDCDKDIFLSQIRDEIISELKPVMEEMESCMKSTLATIDSPDTFINQILPEKDSYFKPDALVKELKSTLSKYNELFKH